MLVLREEALAEEDDLEGEGGGCTLWDLDAMEVVGRRVCR